MTILRGIVILVALALPALPAAAQDTGPAVTEGIVAAPQTIENAILSFVPKRMLSIRVARFPEGFPFPNAIVDMWTVLYFDAAGPDRTHLRIVGL